MQEQLCEDQDRWIFKSDLGYLYLAEQNSSLISLEIKDYDTPELRGAKNAFQKEVDSELKAYLAGRLAKFTVPLNMEGSNFERSVWEELLKIDYGNTCFYSQLASFLGDKNKARAVGKACGSNKIAIIIPCHRVVAVGGSLGGYAYGLFVKQALLDLEHNFAKNK